MKGGSDGMGNKVTFPAFSFVGESRVGVTPIYEVQDINERVDGLDFTHSIEHITLNFKVSMDVVDQYSDIFTSVSANLTIETSSNSGKFRHSDRKQFRYRDPRNYNEYRPYTPGYNRNNFHEMNLKFGVENLMKNKHKAIIQSHVANPYKGGASFDKLIINF